MDAPHQLQTLLQFLVTDADSVAHISYILDHLSPSCLAPSPHLQKWVTRVTSLMHSKDPAARWAATCIAYRMSFLSKSLLIDNAQTWVGIVFPSLSKPEPVPILRASMRYLSLVLCSAGHNIEFQRQVALPIVPKVSSALLTVAEKHNDLDLKILSIQALVQLITLYPSLHKALSPRLFALCNQLFSGSVHHPIDGLIDATVNLYATLHLLGGKVGGSNLWRNCLDDVLRFSWVAWLALRTTFPTSAQLSHRITDHLLSTEGKLLGPLSHVGTTTENPLVAVAINLDRLKRGVSAINALLRASVSRPVGLPIGHLAAFSWCLLASTFNDENQNHFDPHVRTAESAVVPEIQVQACRLLSGLAQTSQDLLVPHIPRLITILSSLLENNPEQPQKLSFLRCACHLLGFCPVAGSVLGINRLLKATVHILTPLHHSRAETSSGTTSQSRASKKRRRDYEVDNILSSTNVMACATIDDCEVVLAAYNVVEQCILNAELPPSARSLTSRVLLSTLLTLPSIPPSRLSADPSFHGRVLKKTRDMCIENLQGISHAMCRGTGLVLRSVSAENLVRHDKSHSFVDLLLHPRRPPFVRTLPFVESLSSSSAEESTEETAIQHLLDSTFGHGEIHTIASEPQKYPEALTPDHQMFPDPSQERPLPTSAEPHLQPTRNARDNLPEEVDTLSAAPAMPSLQLKPDARSPLPVSHKRSVPECAVPMLVNESEREEIPTIDLDSDSDA